MARAGEPQLPLSFARPKRKRGGLTVEECRVLVERLRDDAARVAARFALPAYQLDADRPTARDRYGVCFSDGRIRIRLVNVRTGHPLRYSALVDTLVHELAQLRHLNHGPRWEALYRKMLEWSRREGIYAPRQRRETPPDPAPIAARPEPPRPPVQLGLFSGMVGARAPYDRDRGGPP